MLFRIVKKIFLSKGNKNVEGTTIIPGMTNALVVKYEKLKTGFIEYIVNPKCQSYYYFNSKLLYIWLKYNRKKNYRDRLKSISFEQ